MIGLRCDTCDAPLVLTARVNEIGKLVITRHNYSECKCQYTQNDLLDIIDDAYIEEM
jgi:hypothetical protein